MIIPSHLRIADHCRLVSDSSLTLTLITSAFFADPRVGKWRDRVMDIFAPNWLCVNTALPSMRGIIATGLRCLCSWWYQCGERPAVDRLSSRLSMCALWRRAQNWDFHWISARIIRMYLLCAWNYGNFDCCSAFRRKTNDIHRTVILVIRSGPGWEISMSIGQS